MRDKNSNHDCRKHQEWQKPDSAGAFFLPSQEEKDKKSSMSQKEGDEARHKKTHPIDIKNYVAHATEKCSRYQTPSLPAVKSRGQEEGECQAQGGDCLEDESAKKGLQEVEDKQKQDSRNYINDLKWSWRKTTFLIHQYSSF